MLRAGVTGERLSTASGSSSIISATLFLPMFSFSDA
jgi:hypothetical protein